MFPCARKSLWFKPTRLSPTSLTLGFAFLSTEVCKSILMAHLPAVHSWESSPAVPFQCKTYQIYQDYWQLTEDVYLTSFLHDSALPIDSSSKCLKEWGDPHLLTPFPCNSLMAMLSLLQLLFYCAVSWASWCLVKRHALRTVLNNIPGPQGGSWLSGMSLIILVTHITEPRFSFKAHLSNWWTLGHGTFTKVLRIHVSDYASNGTFAF